MVNRTTAMIAISLFIIMSSPFISHAAPVNQGGGTVTMNGEIIDAACAIAMESRDQVIDMGILPIGTIRQEGQGPTKDFEIQLINCQLEKLIDPTQTWKTFSFTFDGPSSDNLFQVFGEASGIGLYMNDAINRQVIPGKALPEEDIIPPNMRLAYQLRLMTDNKPLRPGPYQSIIRFKVDYN